MSITDRFESAAHIIKEQHDELLRLRVLVSYLRKGIAETTIRAWARENGIDYPSGYYDVRE